MVDQLISDRNEWNIDAKPELGIGTKRFLQQLLEISSFSEISTVILGFNGAVTFSNI